MAASFINFKENNVGTSAVTIDIESGGTLETGKGAIVVGCMVSNVKSPAQSITASVAVSNGGTSYYLAKDVTIPAGDAIEVIQGKVVLVTGDDIVVSANSSSAADVLVSVLKNA